jgi:hypothetical protein
LISLRKSGAGEGIRTLDPNLGKVPDRPAPECDAARYLSLCRDKSNGYLTRSPPNVSLSHPLVCHEMLGIALEGAYFGSL